MNRIIFGDDHMIFRETETIELKQTYVDDVKKEIIAFANSSGGTLYIGVTDTGEVTGVEEPDKTMLRISNMVRDSIKPDVTIFIRYGTQEIDGKQIIEVDVARGTDRPYYLSQKGLRPEGVYLRQGTSSVPATDAAIRFMIKETDGDSYEKMRSLDQELTFDQCGRFFAERNIEFDTPQMKTLGILNPDGNYSNLGMLLSDQCIHTIKAAIFEGTTQNVFKDRREFQGSLLKQLNDAYEFIDLRNQTHAKIEKLLRVERRDYPEVAVREALLNSLTHRDYSYSASILISLYDDRLEFISIGGLVSGVSLDDIMVGLSVCRNPKLANVFYRLQLIEAYGTGIRKIMSSYENSGKKPRIDATTNAFKIVLPNLNTLSDIKSLSDQTTVEDKVMQFIDTKGSAARRDIEGYLNIKQTTAGRLLRHMQQKGSLNTISKGKNTRYVLSVQ